MESYWRQFFSKPIVWINLGLAGLFNLINWAILLLNVKPQSDLIVLHYTLYFGVDLVGKWTESFLIPAVGLLLIGVNTIFAHYLMERSRVASYFFLVLLPVLEVTLLFASIFLIIANRPAQI